MDIRCYSPAWARDIADLYYQSVHAIDSAVYTPEQKLAWAPAPIDYRAWTERLALKQPFVAIIDDRVAGFIELDADGHIDCTYTHPDCQGKGVASALYAHVLQQARETGIRRLYVEASLIARPFFERRGFSVLKQNSVQRQGVNLINFSMERHV